MKEIELKVIEINKEEIISFLELPEEKVKTWNGFELFDHYKKERYY